MARKKKVVSKTSTVTGTQSIGYQGTINLSVKHGNRTIINKQYHNNGRYKLFKFIASCLAGNVGQQAKPVKIKLFDYPSETQTPANFSWFTDSRYLTEVSPYILYDATPTIKLKHNVNITDGNNDTDYYEVNFHFNIPFAYIAGAKIYAVGLYPNNAVDPKNDVYAYYLFTNEEKTDWDEVVIGDTTSDFSLIINWTLSISNKEN